VRIEHDFIGNFVKRKPREPEPRLRIGDDLPVSRRRSDEDDQAIDRQLLACRVRQRDVTGLRRVERAAEDPGYWNSSTSSSS
jgi:hypothetical protein